MTGTHTHTGKYLAVFAALMVLTAVTVGISYLHLAALMAVLLAVVVAAAKGGLVAAYFMHLKGEHRFIYLLLVITVFFFLFLLFVPSLVTTGDYRVDF